MIKRQPQINQTQGLGNASFSLSHKDVLEKADRLRVAKQLLAILDDRFGSTALKKLAILDIGCSSGVITQQISTQTKKAVGIDIDTHAISLAKKNYERNPLLTFKIASGDNLPFGGKSFDVVVCNQVYSYVSDPHKLMSEIHKVLKDHGTCLFTGDNVLRPIEPLYNLPFLRLLPKSISASLLKLLGHKNIYVGNYVTYWTLKSMCSNFNIDDYTIKVLKDPKRFEYKKLEKYSTFLKLIPDFIFKVAEPFFPSFIFVLEKKN